MASTASATAATASAPGSDSRTTSARAWAVQATLSTATIVRAQRGSRRRRASVSRRAASASSTRRGPARSAVETGMACGAPPPVESTQTVPGSHSGSWSMTTWCRRAGARGDGVVHERHGAGARARAAMRSAARYGRQRPRGGGTRAAALRALRAIGFVALAVLGEPLVLSVGHLADDQRPGVDLLLNAVELGLALLGLALALGLGRHGYSPTRRGRRSCGMTGAGTPRPSGDFPLQRGLAVLARDRLVFAVLACQSGFAGTL